MEILNVEANIYIKETNSGLYINYDSYPPWDTNTARISEHYDRVQSMQQNDSAPKTKSAHQSGNAGNGFSSYVCDKSIKSLKNPKNIKNNNSLEQEDIVEIFYRIHCVGTRTEILIKSLVRKLKLVQFTNQ